MLKYFSQRFVIGRNGSAPFLRPFITLPKVFRNGGEQRNRLARKLRDVFTRSGTFFRLRVLNDFRETAVLDGNLRREADNNHSTESGAFVPQNGLTPNGFMRAEQELFKQVHEGMLFRQHLERREWRLEAFVALKEHPVRSAHY